MRLRLPGQQPITLKQALPRPVYQPEAGPTFSQEGVQTVQATVRPLSSQVYAALYGQRVQHMLLVLVGLEAEVEEGMGVCVGIPPEAPCNYRVAVPPERWARHRRVIVERLA